MTSEQNEKPLELFQMPQPDAIKNRTHPSFQAGERALREDPVLRANVRITQEGIRYLNNFHCRLPHGFEFGDEPTLITLDDNRLLEALSGKNPDIPYALQVDRKEVENAVIYNTHPNSDERHSVRFLSLTPRKFYACIDDTMAKTGVQKTEIIALFDAQKQGKIKLEEFTQKVLELTPPAYLKLVAMGFTWKDLSE